MYDAIFKIVIFGDAGCGKTTLAQRFITNTFSSESKMTIGVNFEVKSLHIDDNYVKLQIWDFGGEERFRFLLPSYVKGAHGGLFMYDITNYSSLAHLDDWLTVLKESMLDFDRFPMVMVGGKIDLEHDREVIIDDAYKIAESRNIHHVIESSSKTGENIEQIFEVISTLMLDNL